MTAERWSKVVALFDSVVDLSSSERTAALANADSDLRAEVESLLRHASESGDALGDAIAATAASVVDRTGTTLGHFAIKGICGRGGMGVVYRAVDERLGRTVALKLLPDDVVAEGERRKRFLREAKVAATVNHPNIATIYEVGEVDGKLFIAMELVDGTSLRDRIGKLATDDALAIARQILAALAAAHDAGITHRDLKPENVMLDAKSTVKVLDFGLAQQAQSQPTVEADTMTQAGRVRGTPAYMSPEQARGEPIDKRTDIYAFGIVLQELVTGSRVGPVPQRFAHVITKCIAPDRDARFATCAEVVAALAPRKSRMKIAITIAAMLVVGAGIAFALTRDSSKPARAPVTTNAKALAAYNAAMQSFRDSSAIAAMEHLKVAIAEDPELAGAYWRLALTKFGTYGSPTEIGEQYMHAVRLRARLDARERAIVDALEPMLHRAPPDHETATRRMEIVAARYPDDAEVHWVLTFTAESFDANVQLRAARRLVAIDSSFLDGWYGQAMAHLHLGNTGDALAALDKCIALAPHSTDCLGGKARALGAAGRCDEMEALFRRSAANNPAVENFGWSEQRGFALHALNRPPEAVREGSQPLWTHGPAAQREWRRRFFEARLAMAYGDLEGARRELDAGAAGIANDPNIRGHNRFATYRIELAREMGDVAAAGRIAGELLSRADVLLRNDLETDPTMYMLRQLRDAGSITGADFAARKRRWVDEVEPHMTGHMRAYVWFLRDVRGVTTTEEARETMTNARTPALRHSDIWDAAELGSVFVLAGRFDEALPHLERLAKSCLELNAPLTFRRHLVKYGEALEAKGRTTEACAAYARVLVRWENVRTTTAETARARTKALQCQAK